MAALLKKYQPHDTMTRVELRSQLNDLKMKKTEDPADIFEKISAIENQYNTKSNKVVQEDLIAVIIATAPQTYQAVLTSEQLRLGASITMEDLQNTAFWQPLLATGIRGYYTVLEPLMGPPM